MEIEVSHTVSMGHRLPSYDGICASPHGHNVRVVVRLDAPDFTDFKDVKQALIAVLQPLDHAMVLYQADPLLRVLREMRFRTVALSVEPTTEAIASLVFNELLPGFLIQSVTVHETDSYAATETRSNNTVRRLL